MVICYNSPWNLIQCRRTFEFNMDHSSLVLPIESLLGMAFAQVDMWEQHMSVWEPSIQNGHGKVRSIWDHRENDWSKKIGWRTEPKGLPRLKVGEGKEGWEGATIQGGRIALSERTVQRVTQGVDGEAMLVWKFFGMHSFPHHMTLIGRRWELKK